MRLQVKEWFHEKKMNELGKDVQTTDVFAILKETEKAYNVFIGSTTKFMAYWVPKSCVIEVEEKDKNGMIHNEAKEGLDFDSVVEKWKEEMSSYK